MKGEDIFRALENTDERLIAEAGEYKCKVKIRKSGKWIAAAACACFAAVGAFIALQLQSDGSDSGVRKAECSDTGYYGAYDNSADDTKYKAAAGGAAESQQDNGTSAGSDTSDSDIYNDDMSTETAYVKKWDEMALCEQYNFMDYNSCDYIGCGEFLYPDRIEEKLGDIQLEGVDYYAPEDVHVIDATIYSISSISPNAAVAVKLGDENGYCVYRNFDYIPESLEQLTEDLNLENEIRFGKIYTERTDNSGITHSLEYSCDDFNKVWEMLISDDPDLPNSKMTDDIAFEYGISVMDVSVSVPVINIDNLGLWVTETGYMGTNIAPCGCYFNIGNDRVTAFVSYVKDNFTCTDSIALPEMENSVSDSSVIEKSVPAYDPEDPSGNYDPYEPNTEIEICE
ncbi:MAG: hypothetical protein J5994_04760 [Ruminococcus sp.]|nr:hypothetical protein [Ruminococcus sp.]